MTFGVNSRTGRRSSAEGGKTEKIGSQSPGLLDCLNVFRSITSISGVISNSFPSDDSNMADLTATITLS